MIIIIIIILHCRLPFEYLFPSLIFSFICITHSPRNQSNTHFSYTSLSLPFLLPTVWSFISSTLRFFFFSIIFSLFFLRSCSFSDAFFIYMSQIGLVLLSPHNYHLQIQPAYSEHLLVFTFPSQKKPKKYKNHEKNIGGIEQVSPPKSTHSILLFSHHFYHNF